MTTELQPIDRARQVLQVDAQKAELAELAKDSERIIAITNPAGRAECHSARMKLKEMRIVIEKRGKEARADATAFSKAVIAAEKELTDIIGPEEERLQGIQDVWDAAVAAEKEAKAKAERDRLAAIRARIDAIKAAPVAMIGKSLDAIAAQIEVLAKTDISDLAGLDQIEAGDAKADAIEALGQMAAAREAADKEAARMAEERAELERLRAEQTERDRIAAEQRAEADRIAAAERDRLAAEARQKAEAEEAERRSRQDREDAERAAAQAEADRIAAEARKAQEAAFKAEQARQHKVMQEQQAELRRQKEELARQEDERLERERQEREAREAAELAEREAREAQERAIAEERAKGEAEEAFAEQERQIREATLVSAATAAEALLVELGQAEHIVTVTLSAVLRREPKTRRKKA